MTDTPSEDRSLASIELARNGFKAQLLKEGFSDDGETLQGYIYWGRGKKRSKATISVEITAAFPFAPPKVSILESDIHPTFHIEKEGNLCLWTTDEPVDNAPWLEVKAFLEKVKGWFIQTTEAWPGDEDADLERYLPSADDDDLILYDIEALATNMFYRTNSNKPGITRVGEKLAWQPNQTRMKNKGVRRRERNLAYVLNIGRVNKPITDLHDLVSVAGKKMINLQKLIEIGSLTYIILKYRRGNREAVLVCGFDKSGLKAYESADTSTQTRTLRSGPKQQDFLLKKVLIVGCGAIGSNIADMLFRSGVSNLTLIDGELLRPGNVIRHFAEDSYVGYPKVLAIKEKLGLLGLDTSGVNYLYKVVNNPSQVLEMVDRHDLVIDATADMRATSLLVWAAEEKKTDMITVCLQRNGGVARVDRYPLFGDDETHLPALEIAPGQKPRYEAGCGSPVSTTPPLSVFKAAALGTQITLDALSPIQYLPATIIEVIDRQNDEPYDEIGTIKS